MAKVFRLQVFVEVDVENGEPSPDHAHEIVQTALQVLMDMGHEGEGALTDFRVDTSVEDTENPVL